MASSAEMAMRWVDAWNDLADITAGQRDLPCQLPDWSVVDEEVCRGWLQDSVYAGYLVKVEAEWVGHRRGVIARRWRVDESP